MATTSNVSTKRVQEIDAPTLKKWLDAGEALLIDVREPGEHAAERIPGTMLMPLSTFDPTQVPATNGKKLVLHCQSGQRSAQAAQKLLESGREEVYHLQGGFPSWKKEGYAIEADENAPISLQRQVQIIAGSLILLGTLGGAFLSPWFLLLSGFVGAGLLYAGLSGTCGMAMLLAKLPYNQRGYGCSASSSTAS